MRLNGLVLLITVLAALPARAAITVGAFSEGELDGWQEKSFQGNTSYRLTARDGRTVLHAQCDNSASVLYLERKIDLRKTPVMRWSWRVDRTLTGLDETRKSGDDYPARVYVVVDGGLFAWRTIAVNYVWASSQPAGASWPNAFVSNAMMLALRSADEVGQWHSEARDVRRDFQRLHGRDVTRIDGVAIMTDCDNSGGHAEAWYGDIVFSEEAPAR
jgi:hypothetical protein